MTIDQIIAEFRIHARSIAEIAYQDGRGDFFISRWHTALDRKTRIFRKHLEEKEGVL
mgnify:FL=1